MLLDIIPLAFQIFFIMRKLKMTLFNKYENAKKVLSASPTFSIIKANEQGLIAMRQSNAPKRGILRLLLPQAHVVITDQQADDPAISVRPDPLAVFMVIALLGGVAVEFLMDRSTYPREYPPEFIYGLAVFYIGLLIIEIFKTKKHIQTLLNSSKR